MTYIASYCALVNTSTGEIVRLIYPPNSSDYIEGEMLDGYQIKWCTSDGMNCHTHYYDYTANAFAAKGEQPSRFHYFDWDHKTWVNDIPSLFVEIRQYRNGLLAASDWTQMPDSPLSDEDKANWVMYRDQLRNFPQWNSGATDWDSLVWPTPPDEWESE